MSDNLHNRAHQEWLNDPEYQEAYMEALADMVGQQAWQQALDRIGQAKTNKDQPNLSEIVEQIRLGGLADVEEGDRWLWESRESFHRVMEGMIQAKFGSLQEKALVDGQLVDAPGEDR